jgi:hypothetical protein
MLTGLTSSSSEELDRLRRRYERLCDLVTRTAEADPNAAEHVLSELQEVSEQILVLETTGDAPAAGAAPTPEPRPDIATDDAADQPVAAPDDRQAEPTGVIPDEAAPASPPPAIETTASPSPAVPAATSPPPAPPRVVAFRAPPAAEPAAAPASVQPPASGGSQTNRTATTDQSGSATLFSAAIRQWLERRREPTDGAGEDQKDQPHAPPYAADAPAQRTAPAGPQPEARFEAPLDLMRIASAVEQQAAQIERILTLCEAHQVALERLEDRIEARLAAAAPAPDHDPEIPDLRAAVEEQRQRITALAKTIHNLAQWLAAQRTAPGR